MSQPMFPLMSADELAGRLDEPGIVVCDVRWYLTDPYRGRREYDEAHVPGAVFVDLHTELAGTVGGGRHPLPTTYEFAAHLSRLGIARDDTVVAYDSAGGAVASRLWWMLRSIGHEQVFVLDGGYQAWEQAGLPTTDIAVVRVPTGYPVVGGWSGVVDADEVADLVDSGITLIDARAADRFRGEHEPIDAKAGHIPGAINRPHLENLDTDGRHRSASELAERFADVGPAPIVYCGSGVTACHDLLAMTIAGITDARLYPGSWSDWSSQPDRPVATGD
ncbi:MAG TPA: sulfurtransferase [Ilumatobacteraceae bacterium]|nr:sulfurtransferase [Ilumatobacteraceae bacterium]